MGNFLSYRHPSWNDFTEQEIDDIWAYKILYGGGFRNGMICTLCLENPQSKCFVKNTDSCDCAKKRFLEQERPENIKKLTEEESLALKKKIDGIKEEKAFFE